MLKKKLVKFNHKRKEHKFFNISLYIYFLFAWLEQTFWYFINFYFLGLNFDEFFRYLFYYRILPKNY